MTKNPPRQQTAQVAASNAGLVKEKFGKWLAAMAEGKVIQALDHSVDPPEWHQVDAFDLLGTMAANVFTDKYFRIKPATIMIGDVEVTAPLSCAPANDVITWCLSSEHADGVFSFPWDGRDWQLKVLRNAALWDDRDEAVKAAAAIRNLLRPGS